MRKQLLWSTCGLLLWLACSTSLAAQQRKLSKAEAYLSAFRYEEAIEVYAKLHDKNPDLIAPVLGLAQTYRRLGQLAEAEKWYARALLFPDINAEVHYQYGQLLFQQDDCAGAQLAFRAFLQRKPYDERRVQLEDVCAYRKQLLTRGEQRTTLDHPDFNGPHSDLGPALYGEGLVFGSVRPRPKEKGAFYDLYYTEPLPTDGGALVKFSPISSFSASINGGMHEAILTFSPDGREVYFTRNQEVAVSEKNPLHLLEILVARKDTAGQWLEPEPLPFNNPAYSTAHPAISPDGRRLFFSSDRPGGFGGKDIYVSERIGRSWSNPINLGPKVNTEGDELFPFFHRSGELYFASDGHLGLGGQDVFRVEDLGEGDWGQAENLGTPINSIADDFGLVLNPRGNQGYFTSNRTGGAGDDDIYAFRPRRVQLELQLTDATGQPIKEAISMHMEGKSNPIRTTADGRYARRIGYKECIYLTITAANYQPNTREICATEAVLADTLRLKWALAPQVEEQVSNNSSPSSRIFQLVIYDELTQQPLPATRLKWQDTGETTTSQEVYTNQDGEITIASALGHCFNLTFSKTGYFTQQLSSPYCLTADQDEPLKIYLSPYRLADNQVYERKTSPARGQSGFEAGQQVYADATEAIPYLLNIYYDLGRASVRPEAIPELHKLHRLLLENPDIVIEVGSHTDAQGSKDFNQRLSQRRADAIARWLYQQGVAEERVLARGYGEERLTNQCHDGVNCSEAEHQANRRTEFRVLAHEIGQSD